MYKCITSCSQENTKVSLGRKDLLILATGLMRWASSGKALELTLGIFPRHLCVFFQYLKVLILSCVVRLFCFTLCPRALIDQSALQTDHPFMSDSLAKHFLFLSSTQSIFMGKEYYLPVLVQLGLLAALYHTRRLHCDTYVTWSGVHSPDWKHLLCFLASESQCGHWWFILCIWVEV